MIINEIYVENFGKLSSFSLKLSDGMNSFRLDNGEGKTTLTYFIKAMLYGLDQTTKHSLFENERKRFAPWQGGTFGGYITFTERGRSYRAERSFGAKAAEDKFTLYSLETARPSDDFSAKLGEELFGIDKDGYERTVFISEQFLSGENHNPTISAKLSDLSGVEGDLADYDKAIDAIEKQIKIYKKKGGGGIIKDTEQELIHTKKELDAISKLKDQAKSLEARIARLEEESRGLDERRREVSNDRAVLEAQRERRLGESKLAFVNERLLEERNRLDKLNAFFKEQLPDEREVYAKRSELDRARSLFATASENESYSLDADGFFMARSRAAAEEDLRQAGEILATLESESASAEPEQSRGSAVLPIISAALTVCSAIAGAVFLPLLILTALGAVLTAALFFKESVRAKRAAERRAARANEQAALSAKLDALLSPYPFKIGSTPHERISTLREKIFAYDFAAKGNADADVRRIGLKREASELADGAKTWLSKFPTSTDSPFDEILAALSERKRAIASVKAVEEQAASLAVSSAPQNAERVIDAAELDRRARELEEASILHEREKTALRAELGYAYRELEREDELSDRQNDLAEKLAKYQKKHFVLTKSKELLAAAKDGMREKYLGVTQKNLEKYLDMLGYSKDGIYIDTSFSVSKTDGGATRISDSYSRGTRDLFSLASRLALIDALYDGSFPTLVFDDPYAAFDDGRFRLAKELLCRLASERQVIYLTCSTSREI